MWVIKLDKGLDKTAKIIDTWQVGYYDPKCNWHSHRELMGRYEAEQLCHYLNGGEIKE